MEERGVATPGAVARLQAPLRDGVIGSPTGSGPVSPGSSPGPAASGCAPRTRVERRFEGHGEPAYNAGHAACSGRRLLRPVLVQPPVRAFDGDQLLVGALLD